jgi:Holliday junction resolvase RusA-like endonuclease
VIKLEVMDEPVGKGRPRVANGRAYTPAATMKAEAHVRAAWMAAGRPAVSGATPLECVVDCYLKRPQAHYRKDGTLSSAGLSSLRPLRKPDVDNAAKLIMDALEGYAYPSDAAIVTLTVRKWWAERGEHPKSAVVIQEITA